MRDLLVTLVVFVSLPVILSRPYVGVLMWSWIGYMNPHKLAWGFAHNFPFAQTIAVTLFISLVFSAEPKRIPLNRLTILWLLLLGWFCLTTVHAMYPEAAQEMLEKILKIQLVVFITMMVMNSRERLEMLIWVIVFSLGFFGVKGGVYKLLTGGTATIFGPGGFIGDNNALAIALLITIPLMNYLRVTARHKALRWFMMFCMLMMTVSVIGTFSRAAFLGALAMGFVVWLKSSRKAVSAIAILALLPMLYVVAPQSWHDRMGTISTIDEETGLREASAQSRLYTWAMIFELSKDRPILGAGLEPWRVETYERYSPDPTRLRKAYAAHSIYLSVLAEHGYVGLLMFLAIYWMAFRMSGQIIRDCRELPDAFWLSTMMRMFRISLSGFLVAGAFHQLPYFDLPWHIIGMIVIGRGLANRYMEAANVPADDSALGARPSPAVS